MKVSFVFSGEELAALLQTFETATMSELTRLFFDDHLNCKSGADVAEGLVFRKMVRKIGGQLLLEPVVHLIVQNLRMAGSCLQLKQEGAYLFRCPDMVIYLEPYRHADGIWKLTPYELEEERSLMTGGKPWPSCLST